MDFFPLSKVKSQALGDLFIEEREHWTRSLHWNYREPQRIIAAMVDLQTLPGFVAIDRQIPVGYTFYFEETGKGLIGSCFVARDYQGQGVEERLLSPVLAALMKNSSIFRIESQFINFSNWPIDDFFARNGFSRFGRFFMLKDCEQPETPGAFVDLELRQWALQDLDAAAHLTVRTYQQVVDRQITYHYQSLEDCRNFLSSIILRPGCGTFLPEASYVARDRKSEELVGYILTSRISHTDGHIPQIVVAMGHQGRGIGTGLLVRAIRYLKLNGYRTVSLSVTEANTAAVDLYGRFGFTVAYRFPAFVWSRTHMPG